MNDTYDLFLNLTQTLTLNQIAELLGLNRGTLVRWCEKKEVPSQYYFDLCRIAEMDIDYSKFSFKEKDQFFTNKETASYCYNKSIEIISGLGINLDDYSFIEPSVGDGSFYNLLPEDKRIGIDIEPKCDNAIQGDFLNWKPKTNKNICIGNPPFGLRGHLALKFINHAGKFSDFVCFILPQLFNSNGKGNCKSRVNGLNLIHNETITPKFYYPDNNEVDVNVVFQIWSKLHRIEEDKIDLKNIIKLYSLSDGGTPGSTRNKKHLYTCDYYLPSTCFGGESVKVYKKFEELPHRRGYGIVSILNKNIMDEVVNSIDWMDAAFKSTNGAFNLRFDIIENEIWRKLPDEYR